MTQFKLKPSDVRKEIINCMEARLVPLVSSSPGIGKSALVKDIAKEFSLEVIDLRLSQCAPEDLMGLPMREGNKATFASFDMFPVQGDKIPEGKQGWLLFLDEMPSATKMVQAAAYKLALDRMVGQEHLHDSCFVVAAGNLLTDKAIVNQLSTAMQSRLIHLEMEVDNKDFREFALKNGIDHRVLGFLEFQPSKLHKFQPDHNDRTFACPRTWEFASKLIKGKSFDDISLPLLAGTVSDGVAIEFHTFLKEYENLPKFSAILSRPDTLEIPGDASTRYAILTMLMDKVDKETFDKVVVYIRRLPSEFQVLFFRGVIHKDPSMRRNKSYADNIAHLVEFLRDDDKDEDKSYAQAA